MSSDFEWWERRRRELDARWAERQALPFRPFPRTYSLPGPPRLIDPYSPNGRRPASRPSSSDGSNALPHPVYNYVRRSSHATPPTLEEFRNRRQWPPRGLTRDSVLTPREAEDLIVSGASTFKGYWDEIRNAPGHHRFFVVMESEHYKRTDAASFQADAFKDMSLSITGAADNAFPWMALEQPAMLTAFARIPGTTTITYRMSKFGSLRPNLQVASSVRPKKMKMAAILDSLRKLETGLNEDDVDELYNSLYGKLINDPEEHTDPHYGLERQMADLITILSNSEWTDFSKEKNHVVAKFFDSQDRGRKKHFFHQLLLSVELYLRIHASQHHESAVRQLLLSLPPKIGWDMAIAQRWLENMSISRLHDKSSDKGKSFSFDLRSKNRQKEALKTFASILKWPNREELLDTLAERDRLQKPVEERSADTMSWFTGVVLPGPTLPWLLMNSLIDCDEGSGDVLNFLTHMQPSSGFQYRANTYWSYKCIVGKVLGAARGVNEVAGWIGPCIAGANLKRTECAIIRQQPALDARILPADIQTMSERTVPLGPLAEEYPVSDYDILMPELDEITDVIRVEKLSFEPIREQHAPSSPARTDFQRPLTFDASIVFAFSRPYEPSVSYPLSLRYDVDFIAAFPCHQGPHVLFWDYAYKCVKVDDGLMEIKDWALRNRPRQRSYSTTSTASGSVSGRGGTERSSPTETSYLPRDPDPREPNGNAELALAAPLAPANSGLEEVLAIEALGVSDNEVFARAWCAHWGVSAVVARIGETCMACAIREAYAACVSVIVLTQGFRNEGVEPVP